MGFKCHYCDNIFSKTGNLNRHVGSHFKKTFPCGKCEESFKTSSILKLHEKTHQVKKSANVEFQCEYCTKEHILVIKICQNLTKLAKKIKNCF